MENSTIDYITTTNTNLANNPINLLLSVARWQLFRTMRNIATWLIPLIALLGGIAATWIMRTPNTVAENQKLTVTSAWGAVIVVHLVMQSVFIMLPLFVSRLITQDKKERTYELIMSTSISTWAYVGGRYLALLIISSFTCLLALTGIAATATFLHLSQPDKFETPNLTTVGLVGVVMSLCGCFFFMSLCFSIYTLLPNLYDYFGLALIAGWVTVGSFSLIPSSLADWDPTFSTSNLVIFHQYNSLLVHAIGQGGASAQPGLILQDVANRTPDLSGVLISYSLYALIGIGLVVLAGVIFDRFLRVD